jgi:predicted component of type VI protein secretion system
MFIDLMALKPQSFANVGALQTAVTTIAQRYDPQRIHTKYDSTQESDHGRNPTQQRAWDGYIQTAFTQARSPAVSAPDGAAYKIRLLDVLRNAGKI